MSGPLVIAHRGNSAVAPENTLLALDSALRADADMLEIDIHVDGDGTPVVIHDDTVDRTTDGSGSVAGLRTAQLRELDAGAWFSPATAGQRVPLLTEVVALLSGYPHARLLLEFKGEWDARQLGTVLDVIEPIVDRVLPQSFDVGTVRGLGEVAPQVPRGLLVLAVDEHTTTLCADLQVSACNPYAALLQENPGAVPALHDAGLQVMAWTANEPAQWQALLDAGVDGIITDRPDRLRGWL